VPESFTGHHRSLARRALDLFPDSVPPLNWTLRWKRAIR
jgi:hypothetical protein